MVHHGKLTFPIGYNNDTRNEERGHIYRFSYLYQRTSQNLYLNYIHYHQVVGRTRVPGVITVVKKLNVVRKTNIFYYMHFAILYIYYLTNNNAFVT